MNKLLPMKRFTIMAILIASSASFVSIAQAEPREPVDVARSYFEAMQGSDLDAAE